MSLDYRPLGLLEMRCLFDGRLEKHHIRELVVTPLTDSEMRRLRGHRMEDVIELSPRLVVPGWRRLTDGVNVTQVHEDRGGMVSCLSVSGANDATYVLSVIAKEFDVQFVSENHPLFWGFETEAELKDFLRDEDKFYAELVKFLRHGQCDLAPDSVEMRRAETARELMASDPDLIRPESRASLLAQIYDLG